MYRLSGFLLYKPTDRLSMRLTLAREYDRHNWMTGYGLSGGTPFSVVSRDDAEQVDFDMPTFEKIRTTSQSLTMIYRFDTFTLTFHHDAHR